MSIVLSKKEELLRDCYKVNGEEYLRLEYGKPKDVFNFRIMSVIVKKIFIHEKLDNLFQTNPFLYKLVMSSAYSELITNKNKFGYLGDLDTFSFDHTDSIQLRSDVSEVSFPDTVTGVITFPYFHDWKEVEEWIGKVPETFSVYIINPLLIFYWFGAVGLFLTPKFCDGYYIELCNRFIISLTGYPLFLIFTMDDSVEEINYIDLELSKEDFVCELYRACDESKYLLKILNFWKDNAEVSIPHIEEFYNKYLEVQPYNARRAIDYIYMSSTKAFDLVHEGTGEILGTFLKYSLDVPFKIIDTEKGEFHLTDNQLKDLLDGKYDFKLRG